MEEAHHHERQPILAVNHGYYSYLVKLRNIDFVSQDGGATKQ